jgi:sugar phosphate isomerase/epimerase
VTATGPASGTGPRGLSVNLVSFPADVDLVALLPDLQQLDADAFIVPWRLLTEPAIAELTARAVPVSCVLSANFLTLDQPERWAEQQEHLWSVLDQTDRLGCRTVYGTTGSRGRLSFDTATDRLVEGMAPVLARAAELGITVLIESTNALRTDISYTLTLRDLLDVCDRTGLGACVDACAVWMERDVTEPLTARAADIDIFQISDFCNGTRTTGQRAVPGDGDIPLAELMAALTDGGFSGWYDLEILGRRIEDEGPLAAVRRGVAATRELMAAAAA